MAAAPVIRATLLICSLAVAGGAGCARQPTYESLTRNTLDNLRQMIDVMKGVTDEPSAKAARPKVLAIQRQVEADQASLDKLPAPPAKEQARLTQKYQKQVDELAAEFSAESRRIMKDPRLAYHLREVTSLTPVK